MDVLLFEPEHGGHYFQWVSELIEAFLSRRDRVSLATSAHALQGNEYREYLQRFADRVTIVPIRGSAGRRSLWHRRFRHARNAVHLVRIVRRRQPELVVVPYLDAMLIPLGLLELLGLGLDRRSQRIDVVLMRGEFAYPEIRTTVAWRLHPKWRFKEWLVRRALRSGWFSRILVLDELTYRHMLGWQPRRSEVRLCPEPVSASFPDRASARRELGWEENGRIVGCWGVLDARKGVDLLLRAFAARTSNPNERLLLAGRRAPEIAAVWSELSARDQTLTDRVVVVDRFLSMAEMRRYVAAIDVAAVLYPAHVGGSRVLVEAVAAGKPVLASQFGWVGHVVRTHRLGRVCDVRSQADVAQGLEWAYSDPHLDADSARGFTEWNSVGEFRKTILDDSLGRPVAEMPEALASVAE